MLWGEVTGQTVEPVCLPANCHFVCFLFAVPTKVKKTDLPVIPPESEILPSLDDSDDNFSDDLDDDDIEGKRKQKKKVSEMLIINLCPVTFQKTKMR